LFHGCTTFAEAIAAFAESGNRLRAELKGLRRDISPAQ